MLGRSPPTGVLHCGCWDSLSQPDVTLGVLALLPLKHTKLFSFQASGNLGRCFSLDTRTCMSSNVGWFPASAWKAIWYSGTDSPGGGQGQRGMDVSFVAYMYLI